MNVIRPIAFEGSQLISTNATESVSAWASGTTYAAGALALYANRIWESLQAANTNKQPDTSPAWWTDVGPSNQRAMFDSQVSTATTRATPLTVTVAPGVGVNSLALLGLDATSVTVTVTDGAGGPTIYSRTVSLDDTQIVDWLAYFFEPYDFRSQLVLTDLPMYGSARITASISAGAGTVACGTMTYGNVYELGDSQRGASAGIRDYSKKETDEFGTTTFVVRAFSGRMEAQLVIPQARLNFVHRLLAALRATPCVWIGSARRDLQPLTVFGFYRDFNLDIAYPDYSLCRLEIEGLT
jgi:hypothetical protein